MYTCLLTRAHALQATSLKNQVVSDFWFCGTRLGHLPLTCDPHLTFLPMHTNAHMHTHTQTPELRASVQMRASLPFLIPCHVFSRGCPAETMSQGDQPGKPCGWEPRAITYVLMGTGGKGHLAVHGGLLAGLHGRMCVYLNDQLLKAVRERERKEKERKNRNTEPERKKSLPKYNPFMFTVYMRILFLGSTGKQRAPNSARPEFETRLWQMFTVWP